MKRKRQTTTSSARLAALVVFCVLLFLQPATVFAIGLAQYREKLSEATESLETILYPDENASIDENAEFDANTIKNIRASFSSIIKLENSGQSIEPDHKWLFERLDSLEKVLREPKPRDAITSEIIDRLDAISARISELENSTAAASTKDENKRRLDEILNRPEYAKAPEEKQENVFQRWWRQFWEWLRSILPQSKPIAPNLDQGIRPISFLLQILVYVVVVGLIGFLLYRFLPGFVRRFRNREDEDEGIRIILGETLSDDQSSQSLFSEAEEFARKGNLRAAIRKGYIACLCELSDRRVLRLSRHKTNGDYLRDVRKRESLHRDLDLLTRSFEKHWYGTEVVSENEWLGFRENYSRAVAALGTRHN